MIITVFTPTYNRAYILPQLYDSLKRQNSKHFEWIIVDDGSTDETKRLIEQWIRENAIRIRYFSQKNAGKSIAHNRGVKEAQGELFTCVDSDDYLTEDALTTIETNWRENKDKSLIGILAYRIKPNGDAITKMKNDNISLTTLRDAYKKYGLSGDTMLVYRTSIIKKYEFPHIEGEKFIPEGYLYNKLDKEGKLAIVRKGIYICDYLDDGYTRNVAKLIYNNYRGYTLHINERIRNVDSGVDVWIDTLRYNAVKIAHRDKGIIRDAVYPIISAFMFIPAFVLARYKYGAYMNPQKA